MTREGSQRIVVPADHPALPGHFPGRPVVPGVLLLDAVLQAAGCAGGARLLRVRFTAPVGPGEAVEVEVGAPRPGPDGAPRRAFACRRDGVAVVTGEIACATPP